MTPPDKPKVWKKTNKALAVMQGYYFGTMDIPRGSDMSILH